MPERSRPLSAAMRRARGEAKTREPSADFAAAGAGVVAAQRHQILRPERRGAVRAVGEHRYAAVGRAGDGGGQAHRLGQLGQHRGFVGGGFEACRNDDDGPFDPPGAVVEQQPCRRRPRDETVDAGDAGSGDRVALRDVEEEQLDLGVEGGPTLAAAIVGT